MKHPALRWLLCACLLFSIIDSGLCVSRLFTDEITGYSSSLVTANNVSTDLLIVNVQTVNGSLTASSSGNQVVDTTGSIAINTANSSFSSNSEINIQSYGENVQLVGTQVQVSAGTSLSNTAISAYLTATNTTLTGSNLNVAAVNLLLRTPGEIYLTSSLDFNFNAEDTIQFIASEVDFSALGTTTINSELSNVNFNAGNLFSIEGSNLALSAQSGIKISSEQNDLNIHSNTQTNLLAENIQLNGISQAALLAQNGTFNANALQVNIDSDRTLAAAPQINITTTAANADIYVLSFGTIQSTSYAVAIDTAALELVSSDQVQFNTASDFNSATNGDLTFTADSSSYIAYRDASFASIEGGLNVDAANTASLASINADFNVDSPIYLNFSSFNTDFNALQAFSLNAKSLIAKTTGYIDLLAQGNLNVTAPTFSLVTDELEIFGRLNVTVTTPASAEFLSTVNPLRVSSTDALAFQSAETTNTAQNIQYNTIGTFVLNSPSSYFSSTLNTVVSVNDLFQAIVNNVYVNSQELAFNSDNFQVSSLNTNIDAYAVTLSTVAIGGFSVTTYSNILSFLSEVGTGTLQAEGDIQWSSQSAFAFTSDSLDFFAFDLIISTQTDTSFTGVNVLFEAPVIYGLIQTTISADTALFTGTTSFLAPTSRSNEVSLVTPISTFTFNTANIDGGSIAISSNTLSLNTNSFIYLSSFYGQSISLDVLNDFSGTSNVLLFYDVKNINIDSFVESITFQASYFEMDATFDINFDSANSFNFGSQGNIDLTVGAPDGSINLTGDLGIVLQTGIFTDLFGYQLTFDAVYTNQFIAQGYIDIATNLLNIVGTDNTLQSNAQSITLQTEGNQYSIYQNIQFTLQSDMTIVGDTGFTVDATNNVNFHTKSNLDITSPSSIDALGGNIDVIGDFDLTLSNTGDITIGSNLPTIQSPNYFPVSITALGSIVGSSKGPLQFYADGNNEYHDVALTVTSDVANFNSAGNFVVNGRNGIEVDASNTISTTVSEYVYFVAENGWISAVADGSPEYALQFDATVDSILFLSDAAGLGQNAYSSISFAATGTYGNYILEDSFVETLYDSSNIVFTSTTQDIIASVVGDFFNTNGDNRNLQGSLTINAGSVLSIFTSSDLLFHSALRQSTVSSIQFIADSNSIPNNKANYLITINAASNIYPSGNTIISGTTTIFDATNGPYTFGTTQGEAIFFSGQLTYVAQDNYNVTAGGVNGNINGEFVTSTFTSKTGNYNVYANASTSIDSNLLTSSFTAGRAIHISTFDQDSGIYGAALDASFTSLKTTGTTGVNVTGNAVTISSTTETLFLAPFFTIGQNNAQFNPQINGDVTSWSVNSIGTNLISAQSSDVFFTSESFSSTADTNTQITAGGLLTLKTTWGSLLPGDGVLAVDSAGQLTVKANNYIDYHVRNDASITSTLDTQIVASGTSTSAPSTNGILFRGINGVIQFNTLNTFDEEITTTTLFDIGDGGYEVKAVQSITLTASTGYTKLVSGYDIFSNSKTDTSIVTQNNNARLQVQTEGKNSPISFHGNTIAVASADQILINANRIFDFLRNDLTFTTGDNNNGQMTFTATGNLVFSGDSLTYNSSRDITIEALGVNSDFFIDTAKYVTIQSSLDSTFSNTPGLGGSIRFFLSDNEQLSVSGNSWTIESDANVNVNTNGSFVYSTGGQFGTSVTGYVDINSNQSIALRSNDKTQTASVVFNSNEGNAVFNSLLSTDFHAGQAGYGNLSFVIDGNAYITNEGNYSSPYNSPLLVESLLGSSIYDSLQGNLDVQAYERLDILAFGAANDTGYIKFVSRSPSTDQNGIVIESTHPGGNIYLTGVGAVFAADDLSFIATGQTYETGYISIVNDWVAYSDSGYTEPYKNPEVYSSIPFDLPSVKFDSGTQTLIQSETGDIVVKYGRRLLLRGGSISTISSGGISFVNRGQNRLLTITYPNIGSKNFHSFDITNFDSLTFRTENTGLGQLQIVAESATVRAETDIILLRNAADQMLLQGSSAVIFRARNEQPFPGITFSSWDYLSILAFDDSILQYGRVIRYGVLNSVGLLQVNSHANYQSLDVFYSAFDATVNANTYKVVTAGDLTISASFEQSIFAENEILILSNQDVHFNYGNEFKVNNMNAMVFQTVDYYNNEIFTNNPNQLYSVNGQGQKITFNGRNSAEGYSYSSPASSLAFTQNAPVLRIGGNLYIRYVQEFYNYQNYQEIPLTRGDSCKHDRAFGFAISQGVQNVCACINNVWLCRQAENYATFADYILPFQEGHGGPL